MRRTAESCDNGHTTHIAGREGREGRHRRRGTPAPRPGSLEVAGGTWGDERRGNVS